MYEVLGLIPSTVKQANKQTTTTTKPIIIKSLGFKIIKIYVKSKKIKNKSTTGRMALQVD
jgi:hypothetical protein